MLERCLLVLTNSDLLKNPYLTHSHLRRLFLDVTLDLRAGERTKKQRPAKKKTQKSQC
jgi:hypothetical protein